MNIKGMINMHGIDSLSNSENENYIISTKYAY